MRMLVVAAALAALSGNALAASFDCIKARLKSEKMICADKELSALDEKLAAAYKAAVAGAEPRFASYVRLSQRDWVKARNVMDRESGCADAKCLRQMYIDRIRQITRPYYRHEGLYEKTDGKRRETLLVVSSPEDLGLYFAAADSPGVSPNLKAAGNSKVSAAGEARWESDGCAYSVKLEADKAVLAERGKCAQSAAGTYLRRFDRVFDVMAYQ